MHYTHLEDYVQQFYTRLGITDPTLLHVEEVAFRMGLKFFYWPDKSQALFINGRHYIFLNENQSPQQQWQDFCHELSHVLFHSGDQFHMYPLFREYQEFKANNFMYHACIPTFMLEALSIHDHTEQTIKQVMQNFNVEYDFAYRRLTQYNNKQIMQRLHNMSFLNMR
ncbi:ImmA/IrrE family metallo-endopeptidase [Lysinibacillus irui]|uniref:ImmA/IrrE family metallo-endopeptidase n=1 Tax=Lysinibacillus irui TaxID=2998077 RepID=A0ABU5NHP4_9BACI|nr:ImmA/IrrE family metallo-endopeptidase [Lysinibacillus irui]MEA0552923.1 ImmA/IrrE family metallo-endopeptidase [Lysinibacillus irui]MEA0975503.1 ImmA/IrrE family metallo-endopeptidase [Lysinibacillus irui]MEA1041657.1 ImmA/IrrE family metallo-endopeptidase [Lysinibacillus irui]